MDVSSYFGFPVVQNLGDVYHWLVYHWWLPEFNTFFWIYEAIVFLSSFCLTTYMVKRGNVDAYLWGSLLLATVATVAFFVNKYLGNF
jgi:hypothetical protein